MSAAGVAAGLGGGEQLAVAWFDAHADFNTPETSVSAFLDGMAVSALTGRCWTAAAATVPGFRPVQEAACTLFGVRDLDDAERRLLDESAVTIIDPAVDTSGTVREAALALVVDLLDARRTGARVPNGPIHNG